MLKPYTAELTGTQSESTRQVNSMVMAGVILCTFKQYVESAQVCLVKGSKECEESLDSNSIPFMSEAWRENYACFADGIKSIRVGFASVG
jgi:hypothetical protein